MPRRERKEPARGDASCPLSGAPRCGEELHLRSLLLRPFEGRLGSTWPKLCIALSFTLVHAPVSHVPDILQFLVALFVLAWVWGFLIQRTESLWGAVLFHAGADLMIVVGIISAHGAP